MTHTYFSRPRLWVAGLLLTLMLGCSKSSTTTPTPTPMPVATACLIQKITYDGLAYDQYTFDANGFVTRIAVYEPDANGKLPTSVVPVNQTYTAQGLLDRVTWDVGYEQYTWTNGALSKIEVYIGSKVVYRTDVTTDANKRITGLKSTNVANSPDYNDDYTTKFTLDAQGRYTKLEASNTDGVFYTEEYSAYETTTKAPWAALKGYPVFTDVSFDQFGITIPVNEYAYTRFVTQYGYDDNGKYVGLTKSEDITTTRTANTNNYVVTRKDVDAVAKTTSNRTYQYSNCQ